MSSRSKVTSIRIDGENGPIAAEAKRPKRNAGRKEPSVVTPEDGYPKEKKVDEPTPYVNSVHRNPFVSPEASNNTTNQNATPSSNGIVPRARRTLFPARTTTTTTDHLVTPSSQRKRSSADISPTTVIQSPTTAPSAKRRLIFGRLVEQIQCTRNVQKVYNIVSKLTGKLGGNGYSGPIYGELTMGSMQKMVNLMMEYTGLNSESRFIDVGSGIGKPNLHVAQYPGVEFSCGIEMEHVRWALSLSCLNGVLDAAAKEQQQHDEDLPLDEAIRSRCVFLHRNIKEARTFDPFTHVYMFSIGFPPDLWVDLSEMWNRSHSEYMICYHGPKNIIDSYGFHVELLTQMPTSMHGSKEGHMGYLYKRTYPQNAPTTTPRTLNVDNGRGEMVPCDKLFLDSWKLIQSGLGPLRSNVKEQFNETNKVGPQTRARKRSTLTRL